MEGTSMKNVGRKLFAPLAAGLMMLASATPALAGGSASAARVTNDSQAQVQTRGLQVAVQTPGPGATQVALDQFYVELVLQGRDAMPADTQVQSLGDGTQWQMDDEDLGLLQNQQSDDDDAADDGPDPTAAPVFVLP
jgi:hypothetical protein